MENKYELLMRPLHFAAASFLVGQKKNGKRKTVSRMLERCIERE
jgi:hypothetical protein